MSAARSTTLDGLRAVAVIGVMAHHFLPYVWRGPAPTEVGLFFFFTLTGFLITGILIGDRDRGEASGQPWRKPALKQFYTRRALRILGPYYAAVAMAALLCIPDVLGNPLAYLLPLTNYHIAHTGEWPGGVAHFWSLAIQNQFYLLWPFAIYFLPRRAWPALFTICLLAGLVGRHVMSKILHFPTDPMLLAWPTLDFFACGAWLAWVRRRNPDAPLRFLPIAGWIGLVGWAFAYGLWQSGYDKIIHIPYIGTLQHTFFAIASTALIDACCQNKLPDFIANFLNQPWMQKIGARSYGLYLFHNLAPILAGKIFWFLWNPSLSETAGILLRLPVFIALSWLLAALCDRFVELPLGRLKAKVASA